MLRQSDTLQRAIVVELSSPRPDRFLRMSHDCVDRIAITSFDSRYVYDAAAVPIRADQNVEIVQMPFLEIVHRYTIGV